MPEAETSKTVQLIDSLLDFFADDRHWLRGDYHDDDGRRCLVDAVCHLAARHQLPYGPVMSALDEALPDRQVGLIRFNDLYCRSIAELRAVILKARALAIQHDEHERTAPRRSSAGFSRKSNRNGPLVRQPATTGRPTSCVPRRPTSRRSQSCASRRKARPG